MNGYTSFCTEISQQTALDDRSTVVLGEGLGIRFRSVVHERPLAKANVAGRPFLTYVIDEIVSVQGSTVPWFISKIWQMLFRKK